MVRALFLRSPMRLSLMIALLLTGCTAIGASSVSGKARHLVEVDVIGDSLSTGINTPGDPWTNNAEELFAADGQQVQFVNAAENGAGYVARGQLGDAFLDEVDNVVSPSSEVVLVFGSDNDLGQSGLAAAITATLERVRTTAPHAQLIVVGPPAPPAQQPQQLTVIRDALQTAAEQAHAQFVDPLALKWFQDGAAAYVSFDNEHPNADGEQYLATQMVDILRPTVERMSTAASRV